MHGVILGLLYCFSIEYVFQKTERPVDKEIVYDDVSYYIPQASKPQDVLELLEKLKIGESRN